MSSQDGQENPEQHPKNERHQIITPQIRRRIGEAVVLALFFIADGVGLWPESHGRALLIGAVGTCAVLFIELAWAPWAIACAVIGVATGAIYWIVGPTPAPDVEVIGTLQPGSESEPYSGCPVATSPETWKLLVADLAFQFAENTEVPVFHIGSCHVLRIKRDDSGISIDAELFDSAGRLIATVKNNEFHALAGNDARIERDHSLSKLIIKNGDGREILYVDYMNKATVRVRGLFGCAGHVSVPVVDGHPFPGTNAGPQCITVLKGSHFTDAIFRMQ